MDIPYFIYPLHQLMSTLVSSIFWSLWIMPLWSFISKRLYACKFSFLLGIVLGLELLGHVVTRCLTSWSTTKNVFQNDCTIPEVHQLHVRVCFSTTLPAFIFCLFYFRQSSGYEVAFIDTNVIKYLFMYLLTVYRSSVEKSVFKFSAYFDFWLGCSFVV